MERLRVLFHNAIDMLMDETLEYYQSDEEWLSVILYKLGTSKTELKEFGIEISFDKKSEELKTNSIYPKVNAIYEERQKHFLRFWNQQNACEGIIETCPGELQIIIDALADYSEGMIDIINKMETVKHFFWLERMRRIKEIQNKFEQAINYNRDEQLEKCRYNQSKNDNDVGSDAIEKIFSINKKEGKND